MRYKRILRHDPILFDVKVGADPPTYEVLFVGRVGANHRVVMVPFKNASIVREKVIALARTELTELTNAELETAFAKSLSVDRSKI